MSDLEKKPSLRRKYWATASPVSAREVSGFLDSAVPVFCKLLLLMSSLQGPFLTFPVKYLQSIKPAKVYLTVSVCCK